MLKRYCVSFSEFNQTLGMGRVVDTIANLFEQNLSADLLKLRLRSKL